MVKPLRDGIVVEPIELSEKSGGGVFLPQTSRKRSNEGRIVAVGPLVTGGPDGLSIGDRILYLRWAGYLIEVDGKNYIACTEQDVLCTADEDTDLGFTGLKVS